jgi:dCMP deaminase
MQLAEQVATRSKDPSTQVGCVIVSEEKVVVSTGYNGIPSGVLDLDERMERPAKYLWTSHAEENAVAQAAKVGARLKNGSAYVTHPPCCRCARMLIQAGITTVYVGKGVLLGIPKEETDAARSMFREANVTCEKLKEPVQ